MFSETIVSEMVQIGILVTLLVSEYEKYTDMFEYILKIQQGEVNKFLNKVCLFRMI